MMSTSSSSNNRLLYSLLGLSALFVMGMGLLVYWQLGGKRKPPVPPANPTTLQEIWPLPHENYAVHGIDVSHHQGQIDWRAVATGNSPRLRFAFVRVSDGLFTPDSYFAHNWHHSRKQGMARGAYQFFRPNQDARAQAQLFIDQVRLQPGDLPPVLDIETTGRLSAPKLRQQVRIWVEMVEQHYGVRPILYASSRFYRDYLQGYFDRHPLWVAHYYTIRPTVTRRSGWQLWQHTEQGWVNGIAGKADLNVVAGGEQAFKALLLPQRSARQ